MTHLSAWTHHPEERGAIRLLALWLLLEGSEQAVSKGSRIGENPVQAEGGQPSGWPPAPAPCPESPGSGNRRLGVRRELHSLLRKEIDDSATSQDTRRVAEILEFLDRDDEARSWWEKSSSQGRSGCIGLSPCPRCRERRKAIGMLLARENKLMKHSVHS